MVFDNKFYDSVNHKLEAFGTASASFSNQASDVFKAYYYV